MAVTHESRNTENRKRILLVDDHPIVRQGLAQLIGQEPDMIVCGEAETPAEAMKALVATQPAAAVVDLSLKAGSGLDLIKDIRASHPDVLMLVFSMYDESAYAERSLRAGARGYVMKGRAPGTVVAALRQILSGGAYVSPEVSSEILLKLAAGPAARTFEVPSLTDRELEIFRMLGEGRGTRQIARQLHRSQKTVNSHCENIKKKLNCKSSIALLQEATRWLASSKK
jgi:DNA-binding NarL/FixJ family response regulator